MAWTESRSRDEWLAEVRQRGERLRRRRRLTVAVVAALALVMPMSALAGFLTADRDEGARQLVAGPAPEGRVAPAPTHDGAPDPAPGPVEEPTTTTTTEPPVRIEPINGRTASPSTTSTMPVDEPVVRGTPTTTSSVSNASAPNATAASGAPATIEPASRPCTRSEVDIFVEADGNRRVGEVSGFALLGNRSKGACLLPAKAVPVYRIVSEAGNDVTSAGTFTYPTSPLPEPEAGQGIRSLFVWTKNDCTGSTCVQVPPGTYTLIADWSEIGPYTSSKVFQIGS